MMYETVIYLDGEAYDEAMEATGGETEGFVVHRNAETWAALFDYLMRWEYGEPSERYEDRPWGGVDEVDETHPGYVVAWNSYYGYVSLTKIID